MTARVLAYHERTKHHHRRFAAGPQGLDWGTQPHPFRRWRGARLRPLDLVPPRADPPFTTALVVGNVAPAPLTFRTISQLLFDSLALSAWKQAGGARWSLRVNPSSGNLHPTEGYVLLPSVPGLDEEAAVHHFAPHEHGLERRAVIPASLWARATRGIPPGAFFFGFTSIHWREAWKYGERAFRYCQHDVGHAIAALSFAAAGLGWRVTLLETPSTDEVGALLGVFAATGPEAEHPDCLLVVDPSGAESPPPRLAAGVADAFRALAWEGEANRLSPDHVEWEAIDVVARATRKPRLDDPPPPWRAAEAAVAPPADGTGLRPILHRRRSGLDFDGRTEMRAAAFHRLLESVLPRRGRLPFDAFPWRPRIDLALFVHRVEGYEPGLYWLHRDSNREAAVRAALDDDFAWCRPLLAPPDLPLFLLHAADLRGTAVDVSCRQAIAGDGALSLGMIAAFGDAIATHGPWFYPRLFWEAGALGQRLYVESEAVGLRSTGIGCFFDDEMHRILGLTDHAFQSLYHFTVGHPVEDPRIQVLPPYSHLADGRRLHPGHSTR